MEKQATVSKQREVLVHLLVTHGVEPFKWDEILKSTEANVYASIRNNKLLEYIEPDHFVVTPKTLEFLQDN